MDQRTITLPLYNIETPEVEGHMTVVLNDYFVFYTEVVLINHGPNPVTYNYEKCYPFLLDGRERPMKLHGFVTWVKPGDYAQHELYGNIFVPLDNLEYLEYKYEQSQLG